MNKKIVVIGSSNTDMILKMRNIPHAGETVLGGTFYMAAGGKGANQAVSASKCGGDVVFIGKVGNDMFGNSAINGFKEAGIDVTSVFKDPEHPSGTALIFVDSNGENAIGVASGSNAHLSSEDILSVREIIEGASVVLMQLEIPLETIQTAVDIAHGKHIRTILNPAPSQVLSQELLRKISIITPNETEAAQLTGRVINNEKDALVAARILLERGVECAIITMGAKGAIVVTNDSHEMVSGFVVDAVDTTAAGDVFNGVLATEIAQNKNLKEAVAFANAAAAMSVTRIGAQTSIPYRNEVESFLSSQFKSIIH